jgi:glycosyltransferase involved in cell wall biosynthesis
MNISVVIPVYNGQETITPLVERLGKVLPGISDSFEVILVCDGSPDNSWKVIEEIAARYPWVCAIQLMRNYGQHNALLCGVRAARYELTVTLDDDLQNPPEEIPILLKKLEEGYDVVFGVPKKMSQTWWRNAASVFSKKVVSFVMGTQSIRDITSYRIFRTHIRQAFEFYQGPDLLLDVLLTWGTDSFSTVPVEENPRTVGKSNYSLIKLIKMALILLTSYTTVPLRFASILGFSLPWLARWCSSMFWLPILFLARNRVFPSWPPPLSSSAACSCLRLALWANTWRVSLTALMGGQLTRF